MKILMILISFLNLVIAPIFSNDAAASSNTKKRYSRARRTKLGSRGGSNSSQKKRQEQNLMEDYSRFVFSSYGTTLQYGQSYNLQSMLKYDVHKYYKENGSEQDLNEKFCFGPYMKLTSTVSGPGGEAIDLKAGDGTICTYIKPNTNYAISLTDATEKQISQAVKKNATPCMTSVDKRRVCITRNGQDLQTMHLTSEVYLDTKPYVSQITDAIGKVKTSCGEFTKQMASINDKMGLGVPLTSGLGMALSGAATAVGYMNYKATNEQDELLADHKNKQTKLVQTIIGNKDNIKYNMKPEDLTTQNLFKKDLTGESDNSVKIEKIKAEPQSEIIEKPAEKIDTVHTKEHKELCEKFMSFGENVYIRNFVNGTAVEEVEEKGKKVQKYVVNKLCGPGGTKDSTCILPAGHSEDVKKDGAYTIIVKDADVLKHFTGIKSVTRNNILTYITAKGNCCEKARKTSGTDTCIYPDNTTQTNGDQGTGEKVVKSTEKNKTIMNFNNLQDELKESGTNIDANHKKSRTLDITTAALSGTSAITSTISMGLSVSTIEVVKKSLETLKECKKAVKDLKLLNNKYVAEQNQAEGE